VVAQLARDGGVQTPALQLLIYPATDYVGTTRSRTPFADGFSLTKREIGWFRHNYLDGAAVDLCEPRVSPLLADDLSGRPPALILTGGFDPLRDEGEHFAQATRAARHGRPPGVRFAGPRIRHLVLARWRQCHGHNGNDLCAARAPVRVTQAVDLFAESCPTWTSGSRR
jgi:acetyl esterase